MIGKLLRVDAAPAQPREYSIYRNPGEVGDFRFCMLRKVLAPETNLSPRDLRTMNAKYAIRGWCGSPSRWYGLENSSIIFETVPLFSKVKPAETLTRIPLGEHRDPVHSRRKVMRAAQHGDVDIFSADMERERAASAEQAKQDLIGGNTAQFEALRLDEEDEGEE